MKLEAKEQEQYILLSIMSDFFIRGYSDASTVKPFDITGFNRLYV